MSIQAEISQSIAEVVSEVIRNRKTVFADEFKAIPVPDDVIEAILTDAIWAPNHKLTQPWRFVQLDSQSVRAEFGEYMLDFYRKKYTEAQFPPSRYESTRNYTLHGGSIIFIMMHRSQEEILPEWEEIAAVSCAAQNIWLSCTARGLGAYWDTASATIGFGERFGTSEKERCLGCFFIGYYDEKDISRNRKRKPLQTKLIRIQ